MGWKLFWVFLVAFLLGEWRGCDGCWDQEKNALLQLKPFFSHIIDVENYWEERKQGSDCCEWERVECNNSTGRVTRLFLNFTTLYISDDEIFDPYDYEYFSSGYDYEYFSSRRDSWYLNATLFLPFEELKSLDLSGNSIAGWVDNQGFEKLTSKLDKLEILDLSGNYFNDNILTSLSEFSSLKSLNLAGNQFTGSNPNDGFEKLSSKLDKLEIFDLSYNNFNDSILASLSEFSSLKFLSLAGNQFTESNFSNDIKRLSELKNLKTLDLSENMFGNNIILNLQDFSSLKSLSLMNCGLQGTVQMLEFNNLMNLKELYLGGNKIESLRSLFQGEEGKLKLTKLEVLSLWGNLFNTSIFSFLGLISNLKSLDLRTNRLEGPIQIKELNALSNLEKLYMLGNQVNDFVPSQDNRELRLMNLKVLDLSENLFNNNVLSSLNQLSNLKSFYLSSNNLKGSINLTELNALTHLENLFMSCGFYYATDSNCSLPLQSLALFPSLKTLILAGFSFQGTIITSQNQLHNFTNLKELILRGSFLQTNFLHSIREFTSLKRLSLGDCKINGSLVIHPGFCELTNLQELRINFLNLKGDLPDCFSNLTSLQALDLSFNQFSGNINALESLTSLQTLDLSSNQFSENLNALESLTSLRTLDLSFNQFSENINALESLTSLRTLDLSFNQFSGNINTLESLTSLQTLDLSSNQFSGNISALKSLTSLQVLSLSNNYFHIPISLGPLFNLTRLKRIRADNNTICAENQMHSLAPVFQLEEISLSCCGDVGSFPGFLYHQQDLRYLDLSNIYFKGNQFPNWVLENNTKIETLILSNSYLSGPFQLPLASHLHLSGLDISNNFFNGSIPVDIGAQLPSLMFLNMSKNYFNGSIPSSFGDMSSLGTLDLSNNQLSGGIPKHLTMSCRSLHVLALSNNKLQGKIFSGNFNLRNLSELQLDGNNFSGRIPDFLSKNPYLSTLDVSNNQLYGGILRWMGNMSSLENIIMSNNTLEGTIPVEFCQLDLIRLDLSANNISGSLPSCFGPSQIIQVHLSKNRLRGTLPNALRSSSTLVTLDISENSLTGSIPSWIGGLSSLSYLLLCMNNFEGEIPMELCKLNHLSLINLSHNNLSGRIPPCLKVTTLEDASQDYVQHPSFHTAPTVPAPPAPGEFSFNEPIEFPTKNRSNSYKGRKIIPQLSGIDLSCNKLVGEIPDEFGYFYKILVLNLSHNSLRGPIPPTFANLKHIESLDLSHNNLSGNIPPQLVGLTFLSWFNVSFNNLSGKTPERIAQFGTFEESSYMGNPFLCGDPLPKCANTEPQSPMPDALADNKEDNGSIDMGVFYVSFIVSYIVMLLATVVVLYINPYWRRAWFYRVEIIITSCYYFVIDNVLPRRLHCGNM